MTHSAAHGTSISICISFQLARGAQGHDDGLAVGSLNDALDGDVVVLDHVEDFRSPFRDPGMVVVIARERKLVRNSISICPSQSSSGGSPSSLNPAHHRRTISTFSCDIARAVSRDLAGDDGDSFEKGRNANTFDVR